jgi:methyltransferase (TIGR00027 family)
VHERILTDDWALALADRRASLQLLRFGRFLVPPLRRVLEELVVAHCVRHRAIDELASQAVAQGFVQLVIVGAGYDMRASRFRFLKARWFEVDHPATQERKQQLLRAQPEAAVVERVGLDLNREAILPALGRIGFDPTVKTCFVLEGLLHYLQRGTLDRIFAELAALPEPPRVLFSFIERSMRQRATPALLNLFRAMREIPDLFLEEDEMQGLCSRFFGPDFESWSFEQQVQSFVPSQVGALRKLSAPLWQRVAKVGA